METFIYCTCERENHEKESGIGYAAEAHVYRAFLSRGNGSACPAADDCGGVGNKGQVIQALLSACYLPQFIGLSVPNLAPAPCRLVPFIGLPLLTLGGMLG